MLRFLAGAAACFLLSSPAPSCLWQGRAQEAPLLPPAPAARRDSRRWSSGPVQPEAPEATAEEPRTDSASRAPTRTRTAGSRRKSCLAPRRKAFAKLDADGNGTLSFEEWAVKTIDKFGGADRDRSGWLTPAEYASTAPPPPKKKKCSC